MTYTHLESDRLLALAGGQTPLAAEASHLTGCDACRAELALVSAARRLGTASVPEIRAEQLSALVRSRLAEPVVQPVRRRSVFWFAGLAAAAAFVVLLVRPNLPNPGMTGPVLAALPVSVLHELDDLSEPELEEVLQTIPGSSEAMPHGEIVPLGDLNNGDLERVLRSMER